MLLGRLLLPWIGTLLVSATIAYAADSALTSGGQPAVATCREPQGALDVAQRPTLRATSGDVMYVRFK